jgi:hypothetical protein
MEEPYHLSYPLVFALHGEVWMIPESGAAGGIFLYRADPFPYRWQREACLVNNIEAYDATLVRHGGAFWLFVCERVRQSSGWDTLSLFRSNTLIGDWLPHPDNPILTNSRLCRPGGAMFQGQQGLLRPVQDCADMYGGALSMCRIDSLEPNRFHQTIVGRIHGGTFGCHTYNHVAGLEVIDLFGRLRGLTSATAFFTPIAGQGEKRSYDL